LHTAQQNTTKCRHVAQRWKTVGMANPYPHTAPSPVAATNTRPPLAVGEREASRLIGVSSRTLYAWRSTGIGPPYRRIGGRILYGIDGLREWLNADAPQNADAHVGGKGGAA